MMWTPESLAALPLPTASEYDTAAQGMHASLGRFALLEDGIASNLRGYVDEPTMTQALLARDDLINMLSIDLPKDTPEEMIFRSAKSLALGTLAGSALVRIVHRGLVPYDDLLTNITLHSTNEDFATRLQDHVRELKREAREGLAQAGPYTRTAVDIWGRNSAPMGMVTPQRFFTTGAGIVLSSGYKLHQEAIFASEQGDAPSIAELLESVTNGREQWDRSAAELLKGR